VRVLYALSCVGLFCTGCTLFDLNSLQDGTDGTSTSATSSGASTTSAGGSGGAMGGTGGTIVPPHCPDDMVLIPADPPFCIDKYEATQKRYAAFLAFADENQTDQPQGCEFNMYFHKDRPDECPSFDPNLPTDHPITCIDWCDAHALCEFEKKRLCGGVGGEREFPLFDLSSTSSSSSSGATTFPAELEQAMNDEWTFVCTEGGKSTFPYGNTPMDYCNNHPQDQMPPPQLEEVGSYPRCHGETDVFDMVGNAAEWTNWCDLQSELDTEGEDKCQIRGGYFFGTSDYLMCRLVKAQTSRNIKDSTVGVRCCADALN
jgi:formylglycine-generating enzyme